jgi:DNA invertase Pin-like site-specific DNA recombinase
MRPLCFCRSPSPETRPQTGVSPARLWDVFGTMLGMTTAPTALPAGAARPHNRIRVGYARVSTRNQDHQAQLDALAAADCREVVTETASTRGERPKLRATLERLQPGDTLVVYKPDRVARSMKELLVFVEDELHARGIVLEILTGVCAGVHRPDGATIADRLLFAVAALAAELERELIRERTLDGLRAAAAQGRRGGRPVAVNADQLDVARARLARGESVTAIAAHLGVGCNPTTVRINRRRDRPDLGAQLFKTRRTPQRFSLAMSAIQTAVSQADGERITYCRRARTEGTVSDGRC